jgi:hypothetical protein
LPYRPVADAKLTAVAGTIEKDNKMSPSHAAIDQAKDVMTRHLDALNAQNAADLAATLHFPHYRLVGSRLTCWTTPDHYLDDFHARAGANWSHTIWHTLKVEKSSHDKVHMLVRVNRFDHNDHLIADFDSLWVITDHAGKWAVQFRSSFAPR